MLKNKKLLTLVVISVLALFAVFIFVPQKTILSIQVSPNDAEVYIDNRIVSDPKKVKVTKGKYQIRISHPDHIEIFKEIDVNSDLSLSFQLTNKKIADLELKSEISSLYPPESNGNIFIAKDKLSSSLRVIDNNLNFAGNISIPNNIIRNFVIGSTKILMLSGDNKYFVYNIIDKSIKEIDLSKYETVISVSMTSDDKVLVSGNYNGTNNTSDVYLYDTVQNISTLVKSDVYANFVIPLNDKKLLSIRTQDSENSTTAWMLDSETGASQQIIRSPDYLENSVISKFSNRFAYTGIKGLTSFDYKLNKKTVLLEDLPENMIYSWINEKDLVVANTLSNKIFIINSDTLFISNEIDLPSFGDRRLISITKTDNELVYIYKNLIKDEISIYKASIN